MRQTPERQPFKANKSRPNHGLLCYLEVRNERRTRFCINLRECPDVFLCIQSLKRAQIWGRGRYLKSWSPCRPCDLYVLEMNILVRLIFETKGPTSIIQTHWVLFGREDWSILLLTANGVVWRFYFISSPCTEICTCSRITCMFNFQSSKILSPIGERVEVEFEWQGDTIPHKA